MPQSINSATVTVKTILYIHTTACTKSLVCKLTDHNYHLYVETVQAKVITIITLCNTSQCAVRAFSIFTVIPFFYTSTFFAYTKH